MGTISEDGGPVTPLAMLGGVPKATPKGLVQGCTGLCPAKILTNSWYGTSWLRGDSEFSSFNLPGGVL